MGSSSWSDDFYSARAKTRASTGSSAFVYSDKVTKLSPRSSWVVHDSLNPKDVIRESKDSEEHPNSNSVAVLFDVTGSMGNIPVELQKKLPNLLGILIQKGYLEDPQILFGAIGDATCDKVPLQIGQYESGNEMEDHLGNILIEQGGGGGSHESYELGMYFFAKKVKMDCYEKRGDKGYLFTIGDELPYMNVSKRQIKDIIGDDVQVDIAIEDVIKMLNEKYHYFHILPSSASWGGNNEIRDGWISLLSQNVLHLDNHDAVCETIAMTIGINEDVIGVDDGISDLKDYGVSDNITTSVSKAVSTIVGDSKNLTSVVKLPENITGGTSIVL